MITDRDIKDQATRSLSGELGDFDVDAIVSEIQSAYGLVDIDAIPGDDFWAIVERHAL